MLLTLNQWSLVVAVTVNAASVAASAMLRRRVRARAAEAEAEWTQTRMIVEVASAQARTLSECNDLLCDDCRSIVHGHYMTHAYPRVAAMLAEIDADRVRPCDPERRDGGSA